MFGSKGRCVICGRKLSLFNRLFGFRTCSNRCEEIYYSPRIEEKENKKEETSENLNEVTYLNDEDNFYDEEDFMEEDLDYFEEEENDNYDDCYDNIDYLLHLGDDYNNPYDEGYSGYENHWDDDPTNDDIY